MALPTNVNLPLFLKTLDEPDYLTQLKLLRANWVKIDPYERWLPVHLACAIGNVQLIRLFVEFGKASLVEDVNGALPIHFACQNNTPDALQVLISLGADVFATGVKRKFTCLDIAISSRQFNVFRYLCENHAALLDVRDAADGQTIVHRMFNVFNVHDIKLLLEYNVDLNVKDRSGETPMMLGVIKTCSHTASTSKEMHDVLIRMINKGGDLSSISTYSGCSLLKVIVTKGIKLLPEMAFFEKYLKLIIEPKNGGSILEQVLVNGWWDWIDCLVTLPGFRFDEKEIYRVYDRGQHIPLVPKILEYPGWDINVTHPSTNLTFLAHILTRARDLPPVSLLKVFQDRGMDMSYITPTGRTLLHMLFYRDPRSTPHPSLLDWTAALLDAGVSPTQVTTEGVHVLSLAFRYGPHANDAIKVLLQKGAWWNRAEPRKNNVYHLASGKQRRRWLMRFELANSLCVPWFVPIGNDDAVKIPLDVIPMLLDYLY